MPILSSPALFDINGDGFIDVIFGSRDHCVYAIDSFTGNMLWKFSTDGEITASPVIADIDGDGGMDVLISSRDNFLYAIDGWNGDDKKGGTLIWKAELSYYSDSTAFIMDVDRDGYLEIFINSADGKLYAYKTNYSGQLGWPRFAADPFNTGVYDNTRSYVQTMSKGIEALTKWRPPIKKK
ncbi:MAG: Serine/threonine-protein kinase AfsK [bacterium ADurb.Bin363]|nr:MAG: Serine/threonine-protein kinase AfsK [bacterium ADurb.Bin363]